MKNTFSSSATPMPVSSFFCDQFEAETPSTKRQAQASLATVLIATLGSVSMWLTHLK